MSRTRSVTWPDWTATTLTPKHYAVYASTARKLILNAGRAFGKDHILFLRAMRMMFELYFERVNDPNWRRLGPVVHLAVCAPTSTNFTDLWRRFRDLLPDIPGTSRDGTPNINLLEKSQTCELLGKNQILVSFGSVFRADNIRGGGIDILLVTEAAYLEEHALSLSLIPLVIRPNYAGIVMLNSTPRGPGHWWDDAVIQARTHTGYWGDWELHEGTYLDNPCTTEALIAEMALEREQNIYKYRRERLAWLNVDVPPDALMKPGQNRAFEAALIEGALVNEKPVLKGPNYAGIDLAGAGPDALAIAVIDGPTGLISHLETHKRTGLEEILGLFERIHAEFRPVAFSYDGNGPLGKKVQGRLTKLNASPIITGRDDTKKADLVRHMESHLVHKSLRIPNPDFFPFSGTYQRNHARALLREMRGYLKFELRKERMQAGRVDVVTFTTYSKSPEGTDDLLDAVVYALHPRRVPVTIRNTALSDADVWG